MTDLQRCEMEQAEAASYLRDPAKCAAWAAEYHCEVETARKGALLSAWDWLCEEVLIRFEQHGFPSGLCSSDPKCSSGIADSVSGFLTASDALFDSDLLDRGAPVMRGSTTPLVARRFVPHSSSSLPDVTHSRCLRLTVDPDNAVANQQDHPATAGRGAGTFAVHPVLSLPEAGF